MKNQNKANAGRTQIADISVAGKELSEEHLRIVGGGWLIGGLRSFSTAHNQETCSVVARDGTCALYVIDTSTTTDFLSGTRI